MLKYSTFKRICKVPNKSRHSTRPIASLLNCENVDCNILLVVKTILNITLSSLFCLLDMQKLKLQ